MGMMLNRNGRGRRRVIGEINVTPMVDVMLVLLIVFMITAPLLNVAVPVDLPKTKAGQVSAEQTPLVITLQKNGAIYLQDIEIAEQGLINKPLMERFWL